MKLHIGFHNLFERFEHIYRLFFCKALRCSYQHKVQCTLIRGCQFINDLIVARGREVLKRVTIVHDGGKGLACPLLGIPLSSFVLSLLLCAGADEILARTKRLLPGGVWYRRGKNYIETTLQSPSIIIRSTKLTWSICPSPMGKIQNLPFSS